MSSNWTVEQEQIIAGFMKPKGEGGLGMTRSNAVRKMRSTKVVPAVATTPEPAAAKPVAKKPVKVAKVKPAKAERKPKAGKYDTAKVIELFMEQGLRVRDIVKKMAPISSPYVSRVLFGSAHKGSGGISPEQAARRREMAARFKQWAKERDAK